MLELLRTVHDWLDENAWAKLFIFGYVTIDWSYKLYKWLTKKQSKKRRYLDDDDLKVLIRAVRGDKGIAIRLADYEQFRDKEISRKEAIIRAIERLERDRS